jgi:hypothetical protein
MHPTAPVRHRRAASLPALAFCFAVTALSAACGDDEPAPEPAPAPDTGGSDDTSGRPGPTEPDAGTPPITDTGAGGGGSDAGSPTDQDAGPAVEEDTAAGPDSSGPIEPEPTDVGTDPGADAETPETDTATGPDVDDTTGTLFGSVTRTAEPAAGGVGPLFIAVLDGEPVSLGGGPRPNVVAVTLIPDADMRARDASIPYRVTGIPPRAQPYYVSAFLDDNRNADTTSESNAGPDRGDLVSLNGIGSFTVTIAEATDVRFNIVLNNRMPF